MNVNYAVQAQPSAEIGVELMRTSSLFVVRALRNLTWSIRQNAEGRGGQCGLRACSAPVSNPDWSQ